MKRSIPVLIVALTGLVLMVSFFSPWIEPAGETALEWFAILAAVAFVLGGGSLLKAQLEAISARRPGWGYAAVTLVSFFVMLFVGLGKVGVRPAEQYPTHRWSGDAEATFGALGWLYAYVFSPLTGTMFALLAFYVASAAFRAFRAKNVEATLLLGTAFVVLLARTAVARLTDALPPSLSFLKLDYLLSWLMQYISTAGSRAVVIGIALGIAATSLRILLGIDRPYLGKE
ncbi:MAG: hypothetical protein SGJ09_05385 [Phycisphaerae bacterium]|nr:hypothetical protein [Phycisphaerae bacterium]